MNRYMQYPIAARKTSEQPSEIVTVLYTQGSFVLYHSLRGMHYKYTIANSFGIAVGYAYNKRDGIKTINKLVPLFGDKLNQHHTLVTKDTKRKLLQFYADNSDIMRGL